MPVTRTFLDWSRPALPATADYLVRRFRGDGRLDLQHVIVVLPGGRAARKLTEILVEQAERQSLILFPPRLCTVGAVPELLYESKRPFASDLLQQLVWVQALKQLDRERLRRVIPQLPPDDDFENWMELGGLLKRQHRELAADGLDFAQVSHQGPTVPGFCETSRWQILSEIQTSYLQLLDDLGFWDLQTARLFAIEHRECRTDHEIVLVATIDMNLATRRMLDQVSERVTALVHAPTRLADWFDSHGCLDCDAWQKATIDIKTRQIQVVQSPADQADAVVDCLVAYDGRYRSDQIVVGVLDEQLVPQLLRRLAQSQLPARWVVGKTVPETAPYRLLEVIGSYIDRGRFTDFAALGRHPDIAIWLEKRGVSGEWITELDQYYNQHLPPRLGQWLGRNEDCELLQRVDLALREITDPLRAEARPLGQWSEPFSRLLLAIYGDVVFDTSDPSQNYTLKALEQFRVALIEQQRMPEQFAPSLTAGEAIGLLLEQVRSVQIPSPVDEDAIELLGWLELPLDTAPALIVTSFNEGRVPTSVNSDLFLPNSLRRQLDLVDNRRRYARDAYALSVLAASRPDLTLIAGRYTADDDPLQPSRLAFATDLRTVAKRALAFFRPQEADRPIVRPEMTTEPSTLMVRKPSPPVEAIESISVTSFRSYLACPYRFYLRHILGLELLDDVSEELGAATFGILIHEVLNRFGADPINKSTDTDEIRHFLDRTLNWIVARQYGSDHLPAVEVQLAQARARLSAFAGWQSQWAAQGWEIVHTETAGGSQRAVLPLGAGAAVELHGRIDRIDHNQGRWAVFDYKTADTAKTPQEVHLKSGTWIDLQLPLYTHLVRSLGIEGPAELGYIVLPKEVGKTGELFADWDAAMLESADETAIEIAQSIVAKEFWPPQVPAPRILTDFAVICQDHAFRPRHEGRSTEDQA